MEGGGGGGKAGRHVPGVLPGVGGDLHLSGVVVVRAREELRPPCGGDHRNKRKKVPLILLFLFLGSLAHRRKGRVLLGRWREWGRELRGGWFTREKIKI